MLHTFIYCFASLTKICARLSVESSTLSVNCISTIIRIAFSESKRLLWIYKKAYLASYMVPMKVTTVYTPARKYHEFVAD